MKKPPRFLLSENPILRQDKDDGQYITCTRHPFMLCQIIVHEHMSESDRIAFEQQIPSGSRLDYSFETFHFIPIWIEPCWPSSVTERSRSAEVKALEVAHKSADKLAKTLRRMADWYKSYLIWEDSQPHNFEPET